MSLPQELRKLHRAGDGWREFFEMLTTYSNRMTEITADNARTHSGLAQETVVTFLKTLDELGVGVFKLGRRGSKTRLIWNFSPRSVGEVAQGAHSKLDAYNDDATTREGTRLQAAESDVRPPTHQLPPVTPGVPLAQAVAEARAYLAEQLQVAPERIEINVKL